MDGTSVALQVETLDINILLLWFCLLLFFNLWQHHKLTVIIMREWVFWAIRRFGDIIKPFSFNQRTRFRYDWKLNEWWKTQFAHAEFYCMIITQRSTGSLSFTVFAQTSSDWIHKSISPNLLFSYFIFRTQRPRCHFNLPETIPINGCIERLNFSSKLKIM